MPSSNREPALSVDPDSAHFTITGGRSEHMLVNTGNTRIAVKVRCSDNSLYRVNPVYMFIDAGSCSNLIITRFPGPAKQDKLVFHYIPCSEKIVQPKEAFLAGGVPQVVKLPVTIMDKEANELSTSG